MECRNVYTSRRSIRKFQPGIPISSIIIENLLEVAASAPSSWNFQPWRFLVIQDQTSKEKLYPIVYQQPQVIECSTVVVFLGDLDVGAHADKLQKLSEDQGTLSKLDIPYSEEAYVEHALRDTSFALMQFMLAARERGLDTCLLHFDKPLLMKCLNLSDQYLPVAIATIGYAAQAPKPKLRFSINELIHYKSF
ncbi:MAG TPA: nitroreductase family protein [Bacillota bacterium]|nr:nitroreductase family protein [Bacillota bacterium]